VAWLLDHASEAGGHDLAMSERQPAKTSPAPRSAAGRRSGISLARTSVHRATERPFQRARAEHRRDPRNRAERRLSVRSP
jgi:hypothetical protein